MIELIDIKTFKKKAKKRYVLHIIFISCLLALSITGSLLALFFSNLDYIWNLVLSISVTVIVILFSIFYFLNIFPIVKHYYSYYKNLNEVGLDNRRRLVFLKEEERRDISNVSYRVLQFTYSEGEKEFNDSLFLLDNQTTFTPGKAYKLKTYQNVIVSYEVL